MKLGKKWTAHLLVLAMSLAFIPTASALDAAGIERASAASSLPKFGSYSAGSYIMPRASARDSARSADTQIFSGVAGDVIQSITNPEQGGAFVDPVADSLAYSVYSGFAVDPSELYLGYEMAYVIGVDVTNQVITVVAKGDSGKYDQVIRQFICSTGTVDDPTPLGTHYLDAGTRKDWAYFKTYKCYVRYPVRIYGNYFFHSLLYSKEDVSTLKTSSYNNLGKRASHGCIRMLDDDVKWLSENCHEGTAVVVYEGAKNAELTQSLKPQ